MGNREILNQELEANKTRRIGIITGASSGLGRALALTFAKKKFDLILVGRKQAMLQNVADEIRDKCWGRAKIWVSDLSQEMEYENLIMEIFGGPPPDSFRLLINNAGISASGRIEDIPSAVFKNVWRVNFEAAVSLTRQVIPHFRKLGKGYIVNITSGVAKRAVPFEAPYCASKAALESFTESLRVELDGSGIRVMSFSPGPVSSPFLKNRIHYGATKLQAPPSHGKDPHQIAEKLFQSLEVGKGRVTVGWRARIIQALNYLSPDSVDRVLAKKIKLLEVCEE